MPDRFIVVESDDPGGKPVAWYVSGDPAAYVKGRDPRKMDFYKDHIIKDVAVEEIIHGDFVPATYATAGLDAGAFGQPHYRDMLASVLEAGILIGMEHQQELDRKAVEQSARKEHEFSREAGEPHFGSK